MTDSYINSLDTELIADECLSPDCDPFAFTAAHLRNLADAYVTERRERIEAERQLAIARRDIAALTVRQAMRETPQTVVALETLRLAGLL